MNTREETNPAGVPARAKQAGETLPPQVAGVEPCVWTERMLAALVRGVKGNQWFALIDKVYADATLRKAWERVKSNAGGSGVDNMTIERFAKTCPRGLFDLKEQLKESRYKPSPIKRVWIPKPCTNEKRPLGIPTVRDRIVQTALRMVIEPIFEHAFAEHSYGFRPGRGCKDALRQVETQLNSGRTWVVDADIKGYFDAIPKDRLMGLVSEKITDGRVLTLIRSYLDQGVMAGGEEREPTEQGTPQGAVISPLLANIYLNPLDHEMEASGAHMVRYADDFVILCWSEREAQAVLERVRAWMQENGLLLHPVKTRIVDATQEGGFDFLGYHFERGKKWPSGKSMTRIKDKIRAHTPRSNGHSLGCIIEDLNGTLRGWFGYYKHVRRYVLLGMDKYVRGRLRSILRQRCGRAGRGRGKDHQRWPNHYFSDAGLFSLTQAHVIACRSP
jgi:RNA-directed DNA polymerase